MTGHSEIYQSCKKLQAQIAHPLSKTTIAFAGMQCSKTENEVFVDRYSSHDDCELRCEKDGKLVFSKLDYCADLLTLSPDGNYLLGLSSRSSQDNAAWVVDGKGTTYAELPRSLLKSYSFSQFRGTNYGEGSKAERSESAPRRRYLERFGPGTFTQASWYNRLNPNIQFLEKDGKLEDVNLESYDHQKISLKSLVAVEPQDETTLRKNRWLNPGHHQSQLNADFAIAIGKGNIADAKDFLAKGANPNAKPDLFWTALDQNNVELAKVLIDAGTDCITRSKKGITPLSYASYLGNETLVAKLIAAGAKVNDADLKSWGWTPLIRASMMGNLEVVKVLLKAGADQSARDSDHKTALDYAKEKNHPEITKLLSKT